MRGRRDISSLFATLVRVEIVLLALIDVVVDVDHNFDIVVVVAWIDVVVAWIEIDGDDVVRNNIEYRAMARHVPK